MYRELFERKYSEMRAKAEQMLTNAQEPSDVPKMTNIKELQHEVAVQQVELEMQHDELLKAYADLGNLRIHAEYERERYRQFFIHTSAGLVVLTSRGTITECNPAFARMVGKDVKNLVRRTLAEFVSPQDRMNFDIQFRDEINNRSGCKILFSLENKTQEKKTPVSLSISLLSQVSDIDEANLVTLEIRPHE